MHSLVVQMDELFLPELRRVAADTQQRHPSLRFNVYHGSSGSLAEYQGYNLGVECLFPEAAHNTADNVALGIELSHLGSTPRLHADVVWGHPSGHSEAEFRENWQTSSDWPEATPEVVEELRENFARLVRAFESAVQRGAPPEE
jgi:hypothetical protein